MTTHRSSSTADIDYDVVVVGAGVAGLNALHHFRTQGLKVRVLEAGAGLGGTWYWNRYPGCRVDIESLEYSYAFSDEIQDEYRWPLRYSEQPDVLHYLEWVADKLDLRRDIQFDTHVGSAAFDEDRAVWTLTTGTGDHLRTRYCVMGVGFLSAAYLPDIPGLKDFKGQLVHTGAWPQDGVDLTSKRVGVIGTGATGVQVCPVIAPQVAHLTVFQRTANWCFPIRNEPISEEYDQYVKHQYNEIRRLEYEVGVAGFVLADKKIYTPETRKAFDVSAEEREADYEWRYQAGGALYGSSWADLMIDERANKTLRDFFEKKIRATVTDQNVADKLIPTHPAWARRPPGETGYYEMFNRDNVTLVATLDDPIVECTADAIRLRSGEEHRLDVIICATGFDAGTGALTRIDVRGRGGQSLKDKWAPLLRAHLGMMTNGFPNFFFLNGPQSPSAFFSPILLVDFQNRYITKIIDELGVAGASTIEPSAEAEEAWAQHSIDIVDATLIPKANSWWIGTNIPGKPRQVVGYAGGFPEYRRRCEVALENGFQDFVIDHDPTLHKVHMVPRSEAVRGAV